MTEDQRTRCHAIIHSAAVSVGLVEAAGWTLVGDFKRAAQKRLAA